MFKCKTGEELVFNEVYYIPNLHSNIISLGQLSECGNKVILNWMFLWIYDEQGRLLMKVKRSGNRLYKIILQSCQSSCLISKLDDTSRLWHSRLGHVTYQAMKLMSDKEMAHGLPRFIQPREACTGCLMSKQTRKPFPSATIFRAKARLELIHCNLCGPIAPVTVG